MQTLVAYGATPDFIQVGNEVNNGMLWNSTSSDKCYANSTGDVMTHFISYIKNGCTACREVCPSAKIIFHVAMEYNATLDWANWAPKTWPATLATNSVDYDIIGLSYYPYFHGPLNYLTTLLTYLQTNFPAKEVQLVEVGYPHAFYPTTNSYDYTGTADTYGNTYAATDDGQLAFTTALITALEDYPQVTGLYWWFPEANENGNTTVSQVTTDWYNYGLWDNSTGKAMQSVAKLSDFVPTIGNIDNSTGWWSAFSDYYTIQPDYVLTLNFTNYSSQKENFHNWLIVVTTDADRAADGYSEYLVLRADNYGWGESYSAGALTSNYNWDTFKADMDGSEVVMTVTRYGSTVTVHADITTASGSTYYENFVMTCGDGTQNIRAFLTTEGGHITNLRASLATNPVSTNRDIVVSNKGDITNLINGDFQTDADGWTGGELCTVVPTRSWRGTGYSNYHYELTSGSGTLSYTLNNMPAGTYKVVAAARACNGTITPQIAGTNGTALTGVDDTRNENSTTEINTNGVEMPYSSLGGFTTDDWAHNWRWISATGTLTTAGDLGINFVCAGGTWWMAIDDVHLYCTELDGTGYTRTVGDGKGTINTDNSVVTADIILENPNTLLRSTGKVTTAAGEMNNNQYNSARITKLVLYDGYDYTNSGDNFGLDYGATLYRNIPADTWCTLVVPFYPSNLDTKLVPASLNDGVLTFADAAASGLNDVPMLVKSTAGLTAITGTRTSTTGITKGDMTSGSGVIMQGTYSAIPNINTLTGDDTRYVVARVNDADALYKVNSTVSLAPFRAYFSIPASSDKVKANVIRLNFDDIETGIGEIINGQSSNGQWYNLAGQRVQKAQKGIYIVGGKKVLVK